MFYSLFLPLPPSSLIFSSFSLLSLFSIIFFFHIFLICLYHFLSFSHILLHSPGISSILIYFLYFFFFLFFQSFSFSDIFILFSFSTFFCLFIYISFPPTATSSNFISSSPFLYPSFTRFHIPLFLHILLLSIFSPSIFTFLFSYSFYHSPLFPLSRFPLKVLFLQFSLHPFFVSLFTVSRYSGSLVDGKTRGGKAGRGCYLLSSSKAAVLVPLFVTEEQVLKGEANG